MEEESPVTMAAVDDVVVEDVSSDTEEPDSDPDSIPELPDNLSITDRFERFRSWLEQGGARYEVWAQDCIFVGVQEPNLVLEFQKGFRLKHVSFSTSDERLLKGVRGFFPGCTRVTVKNRDQSSGRLTHRENVAKEAREAQEELEQMIREHADIKQIAEHFDAAIRSVHADHRAPIPPPLQTSEA